MSANIDAVLARLDEMNNGEINYEVYRELHDWTRFDESVKRAVEEACAEYDRMLAEVERAAAAQALEEAAGQLFLPAQGPAHYIDIGMAERMSADWLRARAAEIRERKSNG